MQEAASDEEKFMVLGVSMPERTTRRWWGTTCHNAPISFVVDSGSEATILDTGFAGELNIPREPSTANLQHVGGGSLSCPEQGVLSGHTTDDRNKPLNLEIHCKLGKVRNNVMSVARLVDKGCTVKFSPEECFVSKGRRVIRLHRQGGALYAARGRSPSSTTARARGTCGRSPVLVTTL